MAATALSVSRGVHASGTDWRSHHFRVRDGRGRAVELDPERSRGARLGAAGAAAAGTARVPWIERVEFRKGRARRGAAIGASTEHKVDAPLGDCPINFRRGKMLSEVSSWGIGGPAKMFVEVTTAREMACVLRYCRSHDVRWFVVGKGSNCLFDDRGFDGCIILNRIDFLENLGNGRYRVGSGYAFNTLGVQCSRQGFSGLEFAGGIPGTVGGAVYMNAGANGQETGDVLEKVEIVTTSGVTRSLCRDAGELKFEYRTSPFQRMRDWAVIVAATFELEPNPESKERQRVYLERRKRTQPVSERSAGCVFRNPGAGWESAGALIEQAGLRGLAVGGARVSEKHANFVINGGGSKARDVQALIALIKEQVHKKFGVWLEDEVLYVPYSEIE